VLRYNVDGQNVDFQYCQHWKDDTTYWRTLT
jgi:hypothetical protein